MKSLRTVADVADWRLCLGCGACAYACPGDAVSLWNDPVEGIRPKVQPGTDCGDCRDCLEVCPALANDHRTINEAPGVIEELRREFGPVLEVWEGHAADPEIRWQGSSGGLITALALYCLEHEGTDGVFHIGQDPEDALANKTIISRTREELLGRTGSRYAPASACDRLGEIETAEAPCVFIGQPSEATALRKAAGMRPALAEKVGLSISFMCAGSPSRKGTEDLVKSLGVNPAEVEELRYRGKGWPGHFTVVRRGESEPAAKLTYKESWGFVQAYRPFSTHLCPDGTGEDADLSCGDPWYRELGENEKGESMVLVRTERGREIIKRAIAAGYVNLAPAEPWKQLKSQEGLVRKRGAIWGRILVLRLLGLPAPKLRGFSLFSLWLRLPMNEKLRSTVGTFRRALSRGYLRPRSAAVKS